VTARRAKVRRVSYSPSAQGAVAATFQQHFLPGQANSRTFTLDRQTKSLAAADVTIDSSRQGVPVIADIALIVTAAGVLAAVFGLRQSNRERLRQFEAMYVQRYWSILDQLSLDALDMSAPDSVSADDRKAIRAYLFLCEDELEMRGRGYIADSTYTIWSEAAKAQLKQPMFEEVWNQLSKETVFPYQNLNSLISNPSYDPLRVRFLRRWLRGLAGIGRF
jgi:hypothetical protein